MPGPAFRCSTVSVDGSVVVDVSGELDLATASILERALDGALSSGRPVVLDARRVSFCDGSGVGMLLEVDRRARRDGASLSVLRGAAAIERIFALLDIWPSSLVAPTMPRRVLGAS